VKQNLVTKRQNLLDDKGFVIQQGYSNKAVWIYNKEKIRCCPFSIKEWDRYIIFDYKNQSLVTTTYSKLGYLSYFAISYIDLKNKDSNYIETKKLYRANKHNLPLNNKDYSIGWANKKLRIAFSKRALKKRLLIGAPNLEIASIAQKGLIGDFSLFQDPLTESFNLATCFSKKKSSFSLSGKIMPLKVSGLLTLGSQEHTLDPKTTRALMYWQRGRWRYKDSIYWAASTGFVQDEELSFSFGEGLGNKEYATENYFTYNNKIYKLENVDFIKGDNWTIKDNQEKVSLSFSPIVEQTIYKNLLITKSDQNQLYGYFNGTIEVDSKTIEVKDFIGFIDTIYTRN
jgi:hypothetical protein